MLIMHIRLIYFHKLPIKIEQQLIGQFIATSQNNEPRYQLYAACRTLDSAKYYQQLVKTEEFLCHTT